MPNWQKQLQRLFPAKQCHTDPAYCWNYGYDNSRVHHHPEAVVFAEQEQDIQKLVQFCNQQHCPLTVRGRGTATTGAAVPVAGGIILSTERLQVIHNFDRINRSVDVQPGVINGELQRYLQPHGLFWPPDPSSADYCSIGGNLAVNAAGPRAIKYGSCRENVLGLRAILGNGEIIQTGSYTHKSNVGYDLTRLLIGSQGMLGIISQATLKLWPTAEASLLIQANFASLDNCLQAVCQLVNHPVIPDKIEFMDPDAIELIKGYDSSLVRADCKAMLLIELTGNHTSLPQYRDDIEHLLQICHVLDCKTASQQQQLWAARKALSPALRQLGSKKINEDVVVPLSRLAELLDEIENLRQQYQLTIVSFGHIGSGNLHVNIMLDGDCPKQNQAAEHCLADLFQIVMKLQGSLSGEHGIGLVKRDFIKLELGNTEYEFMQQIKQIADPQAILNPGKI